MGTRRDWQKLKAHITASSRSTTPPQTNYRNGIETDNEYPDIKTLDASTIGKNITAIRNHWLKTGGTLKVCRANQIQKRQKELEHLHVLVTRFRELIQEDN